MFQQYAYDPDAVRPDRMRHYVGALRAGLGYYDSYFVSAAQNQQHSKETLTIPALAIAEQLLFFFKE